jgi:hypothetical protein
MGSLAAGRRQLNGWMSGHEQHEGWAAATLWLDGWASAARRLGDYNAAAALQATAGDGCFGSRSVVCVA